VAVSLIASSGRGPLGFTSTDPDERPDLYAARFGM
jgi:hypothetical protein